MKILFVNHIPEHFIKDKDPIGIMSLSATLKKSGHEVRICSPHMQDVQNILKIFPASIVAYSVTTGYHNFYLKFNDALKKQIGNIFTIFGGPHPTFTPSLIEESEYIDAICRGEADYAMVDFTQRLADGGNYHLTPNFCVRRNGKIYKNPVRNLVDNLDELPFPDRELIYTAYPLALNSKVKNFMTMRGCPYNCSYCFNAHYNSLYQGKGRIMRRRSVDNVIREVADVAQKYPLEFVCFIDDTFTLFPDWVVEFSSRYKRDINIPFMCYTRLNLVTEKTIRKLREANCVSMVVAIESGSDHIRNGILRRNMSREQITDGMKILRSNGIKVMTENLIGVPGSTLEDDLKTYSLNKECAVYYVGSTMLQPYRGTDIHEYAQRLELYDDDIGNISPEAYLRGKSLLKLANRKQRERLNKIIALSCKLRLPMWLVKVLISLPLMPVYSMVLVILKGYCGTKLYPSKYMLKEKFQIFLQLFRQHHIFGSVSGGRT